MIIHRLANAIRNQNWSQIITEILIVVIGIFLGLQVTEWSDLRAERQEERAYLLNLENDLTTSIQLAKEDLNISQHAIRASTYILDIIAEQNPNVEQDKVDEALYNGLFNLTPMRLQLNTLNEMISSGKLALIRSDQLRTKLVGLTRTIEAIRTQENYLYDLVIAHMDPLLIEKYSARNYVRFQSSIKNNYIGEKYLQPVSPDGLLSLLNDKKTENAIYYRLAMQTSKMDLMESLIRDYEETLEMIKQ